MKRQEYLRKYNLINNILISWNPLGVDGPILKEEYIPIIPSLIRIGKDENKLKEYLTNLLEKKYGVNYSKEELIAVVFGIMRL